MGEHLRLSKKPQKPQKFSTLNVLLRKVVHEYVYVYSAYDKEFIRTENSPNIHYL